MQCEPDGGDERQCGECRDHRREWEQECEHGSGHEAPAAHPQAPLYPAPDRRVREEVERAPAAERERSDRVELLADVADDRLQMK